MKKLILIFVIYLLITSCNNEKQTTNLQNNPPIIDSVIAQFDLLSIVPIADITCYARDIDGDSLTYKWRAISGEFYGSGRSVKYVIPPCCDSIWNKVTVEVIDSYGLSAKHTLNIKPFRK